VEEKKDDKKPEEEKKDEEEDNDDEIHIPLPPSGQVEYEEQIINTDDL
jgi:hypothetical protein